MLLCGPCEVALMKWPYARGLLPDAPNRELRMHRECRELFPRHRGLTIPACATARAVTHVPWCLPGSLTHGFLWRRWWGKRSRYSRRMHNPQFYVAGKRPIAFTQTDLFYWTRWDTFQWQFHHYRTIYLHENVFGNAIWLMRSVFLKAESVIEYVLVCIVFSVGHAHSGLHQRYFYLNVFYHTVSHILGYR